MIKLSNSLLRILLAGLTSSILITGLGLPVTGRAAPLPPATPPPGPADALVLIRIPYHDRAELGQLAAAGLDIWEVHDDYALAAVTPADQVSLSARGVRYTTVGPAPAYRFDPLYHDYNEMLADLQRLAAAYPHLARLVNLGPSWEKTQNRADRSLWALRVTANIATAADKPRVLYIGGHHAREIVPPEVVLLLAQYLLTGYGQDATATYWLDTREVWLLPLSNPDGTTRAATNLSWRKNTNDSAGNCPGRWLPDGIGIDLNRNFSYHWGEVGASNDPCSATYRGSAPLSEPENQAIRDLLGSRSFNLVISLHSYGQYILWPWGYTWELPPDQARFLAIGRRMAAHNHYTYGPINTTIYPTSGDLMDWSYGELGILAFGMEIGTRFDPPYTDVQPLWNETRDGLLYLLKVTDRPAAADGPDALAAGVITDSLGITLTAILADTDNGGQTVVGGEYFVDQVGPEGSGYPLLPLDGAWDSDVEVVAARLEWPGPGRHLLLTRGRDSDGHWGTVAATFVERPVYRFWLHTVMIP